MLTSSERGVVEVEPRGAAWPHAASAFVDAPVEPDAVPARSERQPVEVDRGHPASGSAATAVYQTELADEFLPVYDVSDAVAVGG